MITRRINLAKMKATPAWAWLKEDGQVRGCLNMQTGAYTTPCIILVERRNLKAKARKKAA